MYQVTLVNLTPDARHAGRDLGASASRACDKQELGTLLEAFRGIDPSHHVEPEPEIRIQNRGARCVVTVAHGRLLFADARDRSRPTLTLSVAEILAELDGSAAARSVASPQGSEQSDSAEHAVIAAPTAAPARHRARVSALSAVAVILLIPIVLLSLPRGGDRPLPFDPLPAAEMADTARTVAAVYVTGDAAGSRGIVVGGEGVIRIFELNAAGAPSFVHGTWQAGRIKGALCLRIPELGTVVEIVDRETIIYCGERYRRAASS